jgi:branched-chain amino acid transport system ATP-binding protein
MLEIRGLDVRYGPVHAVKDVSLTVGDQQVIGLLGANGAGKSSILRAVSGLAPCSGRISFDGLDIRGRSVEAIVRAGIIHVPEGRRLFKDLNVHENLAVGLTARHGRSASYEIADVYDLFPALTPLRDRPAWALSGGEQQMVALGRAMVAAPRLLMLDEPSLGLSPKLTDVVYRTLPVLAQTTSILLVEQQSALALRICNRATVLSMGHVVLEESPEQLGDRSSLMRSYLGGRPTPPTAPQGTSPSE